MKKAYEVHWIEEDEVLFKEFDRIEAAKLFNYNKTRDGYETYFKEIQA